MVLIPARGSYGITIGLFKGDTRSLDYSSCRGLCSLLPCGLPVSLSDALEVQLEGFESKM